MRIDEPKAIKLITSALPLIRDFVLAKLSVKSKINGAV